MTIIFFFYVKKADASRVYGLELNIYCQKINFSVYEETSLKSI
jgi:hypothetical protein